MSDDRDDDRFAEYWGYIIDALTYQAKGKPLPEDVADHAQEAVMCIAAATLVQAGMSMDVAERKFCDEDYTIKLTYGREDDSIGIEVTWDDGTTTTAARAS